jgi:hypothetical protein
MNKVSSGILISGLSTLIFVPQILAQTSNLTEQYVTDLGDRNLAIGKSTNPISLLAASSRLVIDRIETNTSSRRALTEGDELIVTAYGTPRSIANFSLDGINRNRTINMIEIERGVYEGSYTIRRNDRQVNSRLTVSLSRQGIIPTIKEYSRLISINPNGNGNSNNLQNLRPEITNVRNNSVVRLPIDLLGQTLPNANVTVTVDAQRSVLGIVDFSQSIVNTTVRANRQGEFIVNLPSRNLRSGTTYRVRLNATLNNQSQSNEFILIQN